MTKFWEDYPPIYDFIQLAATGGFLKVVGEELKELKNKNVLDLGCGTGNLAPYFSPNKYIGVDFNPKYIEYAQIKHPRYRFIVGDITKDSSLKVNFDCIVIINVLHHINNLEINLLITNLKRLYKNKEIVIVESCPTGILRNILQKLDAGDNFRDFKNLEKLLSGNLKISKKKELCAPWGTYKYLLVKAKL